MRIRSYALDPAMNSIARRLRFRGEFNSEAQPPGGMKTTSQALIDRLLLPDKNHQLGAACDVVHSSYRTRTVLPRAPADGRRVKGCKATKIPVGNGYSREAGNYREALDAAVAAMASEQLAAEVVREQMMIEEGLK